MTVHKIAVIPGDGIGKEVITEGNLVLHELSLKYDFRYINQEFDWGSEYFHQFGRMMPTDALVELNKYDAIYFGAVGAPGVPDHISLWGLRLAICQSFDQYANIRPIKVLQGIQGPLRSTYRDKIDWVIVRENSEGEYSGQGGRSHVGHPEEVATEISIFTRAGVTRILDHAFRLAQQRPRKQLTVVTKSNAQRHGLVMWDEIAAEIAARYPDVTWDKMLVDAMTVRMVLNAGSLDTIVATNLHADILSDLGAALVGSLGVAATANINPSRQYPSMFEPIHGSGFDIAGKGIANPLGAFLTLVLMLTHLGEFRAADGLTAAIEAVASNQENHTPDLGGTATTASVTAAIIQTLQVSASKLSTTSGDKQSRM